MADVTINNLTGQVPTNTDVFPFSTTGVTPSTYKTTLAQLKTALSIPAAQVNSDWNSTSGVAQILNKPSIPSNNQIARAWVNFDGRGTISANQTIRSQYNIASVYKTGTGSYRITFSSALSDANYIITGSCAAEYGAYWLNVVINSDRYGSEIAPTSQYFDIATIHQTVGGGHDSKYVNIVVFGI